MMNSTEALAALATGHLPGGEALLHTCLLEGWGAQAFGEEAVLETFRAAPQAATDWDWVESPAGVALFGDESALFADTVDGRLRRVWRLGGGKRLPEERVVSVAFDPDLAQARGDVVLSEPSDLEEFPSFLERQARGGGTPAYRRPCCVGQVAPLTLRPLHDDLRRFEAALAEQGRPRSFMNAASPGVIALFQPDRFYGSEDAYLEALADNHDRYQSATLDQQFSPIAHELPFLSQTS